MIEMTNTKLTTQIRWMGWRDMPEVMAIENAGFPEPLTENELLQILRRHECIGMVAELGKRVLGFMVYEVGKPELTVLDFAVHPAWRHRGVGRQMIAELAFRLTAHLRTRIVMPVWEGNLDAHLFLRACGFEVIGIDREVYPDGDSDYVFEYRLPASEDR